MKPITLTEDFKEQVLEQFKSELSSQRMTEGKFKFEKDVKDILNKQDITLPTVLFTPQAFVKLRLITNAYNKEVGYHGLVTRSENNTFTIFDIITYPQQITGSTVTTDDLEYAEWLHYELNDETFNHLRFHGHSHNNMGVSPSQTDINMYNNILQTLQENDYYIFLITNKNNTMHFLIYDFQENIIFENTDISWNIAGMDDWLEKSKARVTEQTFHNYNYNISRSIYEDYYGDMEQANPQQFQTQTQTKGGKKKNNAKSNKAQRVFRP